MMIEDYFWFTIVIIVNVMAFVKFYFLAHGFGGHEFNLKPLAVVRSVFLTLIFGISMALLERFVGDGWVSQFILNFIPFLWVWYLTKRNFFDNIIIVAMTFVTVFIIQGIILLLMHFVNLSQEALFVIVQSLTVFIIILISFKIKLHDVFAFVQRRIYLKVCIHLIVVIFILAAAMVNFDVNYIWQQSILFGVLIIIILVGIVMTIFATQTQIDKSAGKYHDVVNMFTGLHLSIQSEDDIEELKRQSNEMVEYLTDRPPVTIISSNYKKNLEIMLRDKLLAKEKDNELRLDIGYYEHHEKVSFLKVSLMLGTLIDNAIEHGLDEPIFVYMNVSEDIFELSVKNFCQEISPEKLKKLFKKGYTTKENIGNGHGLYKLDQEVKKYNNNQFKAEIVADTYYDMEYENHLFEITVDISTIHAKQISR